MKSTLKQALKCTPLYHPLRNWRIRRRQTAELAAWERRGRPVPPPHIIKQNVLRHYAGTFGLKILVETGTFYGDMLEALTHDFDRLYSIELGTDLFDAACRRFKKVRKIELIHGDSGVELKKLMNRIDQPALFWLDGHYYADAETARGEKDTPIFEELDHIFSAPDRGHVIIVDDARCFGTDPAYPALAALGDFIKARRPAADVLVENDIIRITPHA